MRRRLSFGALAYMSLAALLVVPLAAHAATAGLTIQAKATRAYAKAGASGYSAYAVVTFTVNRTSTGFPEINLAPSVGDGTPLPALPPGFTRRDLWIKPDPIPEECLPTPILFRNLGGGAYAIYLAPGEDRACAWTSGDYHFSIQFLGTVGNETLAGTGLVDLAIP